MAKEIRPEGLFIGSDRAIRVLGDRHPTLKPLNGTIIATNPHQRGIVAFVHPSPNGPMPESLFCEAQFMDRRTGYGIYADAFRIMSIRKNKSRTDGITASMRVIPYTIHVDGDRRLLVPGTSFLLYGDVQAIQFEPSDLDSPDLDDTIEDILAKTLSKTDCE